MRWRRGSGGGQFGDGQEGAAHTGQVSGLDESRPRATAEGNRPTVGGPRTGIGQHLSAATGTGGPRPAFSGVGGNSRRDRVRYDRPSASRGGIGWGWAGLRRTSGRASADFRRAREGPSHTGTPRPTPTSPCRLGTDLGQSPAGFGGAADGLRALGRPLATTLAGSARASAGSPAGSPAGLAGLRSAPADSEQTSTSLRRGPGSPDRPWPTPFRLGWPVGRPSGDEAGLAGSQGAAAEMPPRGTRVSLGAWILGFGRCA